MSGPTNFYIKRRKLLRKPYHYVECGLDDIFLLNGVSENETKYGVMVHVENLNGLHRAIGLHIVEKEDPMSGAEFRFLRKQMEITQAKLAKVFSVTDQTIANYEKDNSRLGPADALMRACYLFYVLPSETRLDVLKAVRALAPEDSKPSKVPDAPRRQIVDSWAERRLQAA